MENSDKTAKPISHNAFPHLNKRVTVLGYPPVLGALLLATAVLMPVSSFSFKSAPMGLVSFLYLLVFVLYTLKNMKNIKENRLDVITLIFFEGKRQTYVDSGSIINNIKKRKDERHS